MSIQTADIKVLMSANAVRKYLGISHRLTKEFLAGVPALRHCPFQDRLARVLDTAADLDDVLRGVRDGELGPLALLQEVCQRRGHGGGVAEPRAYIGERAKNVPQFINIPCLGEFEKLNYPIRMDVDARRITDKSQMIDGTMTQDELTIFFEFKAIVNSYA
jgi:hypothetical protein